MEWLNDFLPWAWARHHNLLSWYIRPLFLLPFCYFAYRRSWRGILLTLVGLATSMFWFPAPAQPDPRAITMLEAEREYLTGAWPLWKIGLMLLVPAGLTAVGAAFWKRSFWYGVAVINAMVLTKIVWTFVIAEADGALLHLTPAVLGLAICNVVLVVAVRLMQRHSGGGTAPAAG
jgi:hypothetical protein